MALAAFRDERQESNPTITCEDFFVEFGDYLENQVSPEVRKELELHLSQCRACHVLYDSTCKTVKIVTESSSFELPKSVSDPIIDRVMAKLRCLRLLRAIRCAISPANRSMGNDRFPANVQKTTFSCDRQQLRRQ